MPNHKCWWCGRYIQKEGYCSDKCRFEAPDDHFGKNPNTPALLAQLRKTKAEERAEVDRQYAQHEADKRRTIRFWWNKVPWHLNDANSCLSYLVAITILFAKIAIVVFVLNKAFYFVEGMTLLEYLKEREGIGP